LDNTQAEVDRFVEVVKEIRYFSGNESAANQALATGRGMC
jgi:hypothetical protein